MTPEKALDKILAEVMILMGPLAIVDDVWEERNDS